MRLVQPSERDQRIGRWGEQGGPERGTYRYCSGTCGDAFGTVPAPRSTLELASTASHPTEAVASKGLAVLCRGGEAVGLGAVCTAQQSLARV